MTQPGADTTNPEATVRGEQMLRKAPSSERGSIDSRPTEAEATDEVQLTFLIPSNERYTKVFNISDTAQHAKQTLLDDWPAQLGPKPASPSDLKLLYGGNFLDNNTTLDGKHCEIGLD
ncbi:hypothetical protein IW147_000745 [Coemansia sp. RSA 720]|nr:hypothetical protein IW147_000745 [Coemansia sp. RSA 720]KAJ2667167.1 hypothetical protein IW148_000268 [Coemansia sp. RSA 1199]